MAHQSTTWGASEAGAPRQAPSRKPWIWAIPIVCVALLGAAAFWHFFPAWNGHSATTASLSLELQRAGSDYRVTWNAQSPVVQAAKRGTLLIKDGSFEKELELDREQLLSSGLVYSPATADVSFSLKLFGAGPQPTVSSVRLLAGSRPQVAAEVPIAETAPPVETAPAPPPAEQSSASAEQPAAPTEQPLADAPATIAAAPKPDDIPQPAQ